MNIAQALLEAKRFQESEAEFKRALELPEHASADERRIWRRADLPSIAARRCARHRNRT